MRTPDQLLGLMYLTREEADLVDRLEREIDESMDRSYDGGVFVFHCDPLPRRVVGKLSRKYKGWRVEYFSESHPRNETVSGLKFTPI